MGMQEKRVYLYQGREIQAIITTRLTHRVSLRFDAKGVLKISVPPLTSKKYIDNLVKQYLPKMLAKKESKTPDIDERGYYLFGQYIESSLTKDEIQSYLSSQLLEYLQPRVRYYESLMEVTPFYKVIVRNMSTRYGVNSSKTHRLEFALSLAHYDRKIIDAIIVHELAHHFERNHQKGFYDIVYRYCPEYKILMKKLKEHIHA